MYKNTYLTSPLKGEIIKNNQYTNVSEHEAKSLALAVQEMYKNNGIPYQAVQTVHRDRSPEISVTISHTGITFKLGMNWKTTKITTFTPKGDLR